MSNLISQQSNPFFKAQNNNAVSNVTGDGTTYIAIFDTLVSGSGYDNTTGIYTVPIAGEYFFETKIYVTGLTSSHTLAVANFVATSGTYEVCDFNTGTGKASDNTMTFTPATIILKMSAGDTIKVNFTISNGTKVVSFGSTLSKFSGVRL